MRLPVVRKTVQLSVLALLAALPVLNAKGWTVVSGSLYSLAIGPLWLTDPLIGLQTFLTTRGLDTKLLLSVLLPVLAALALGRVFCSWVCPQNLLSELADSLTTRLGVKRLFRPRPTALTRYVVLAAVLALTALVGLPLASLLSAPGIISVQISRVVNERVPGLELSLVGAVLLAEVFLARRVWCNHACPVGAFLGLLRVGRTMKVGLTKGAAGVCTHCRRCSQVCQLGLNPMEGGIYPLCHNCGDCVAACAAVKGGPKPLSFRF